MAAYYNEIDHFAAAWLRELMKAGQIPDGEIDTRSIEHVRGDELREFKHCHFFAGIGGWAYALRLAGWPDDREVWTGSCPCQPFSQAGARRGADDERHLWPIWCRLVRECRPPTIFGEQVASSDGLEWLDGVCADLESERYAVGAADLPAASVGAFHIRQRLWFVANRLADDDEGGCQELGTSRLHDHRQSGDDATRRGAAGDIEWLHCADAWDDCAVTATRSFRKWQRSSLQRVLEIYED